MITVVFPGQGSQSKGMGGALFDEFMELTAQADRILGYSLRELCLEDPDLKLSLTQYTQPAIFVVNALSYLKAVKETGEQPDFLAGHSLGEYNALFASGVFDFETGLKLVKKRGELMGQASGGGMAAVIGLNETQIAEVLLQHHLETIDVANLNSPFQIVISGPKDDIDQAQQLFEAHPDVKLFTPLKTSGAFHSRYMEAAKQEFEEFLNSFEFKEITIPVISNVTARPYRQFELKQNLVVQMTQPVKWTESIQYLMGRGVMEFKEIGAGRVLTGLIQRIKKEAQPLVISSSETDNAIKGAESLKPGGEKTAKPTETVLATDESLSNTSQISKAKQTKPGAKVKRSQKAVSVILPESLGSSEFKKDFNLKYAYLTGGMYRGIASQEMVVKMAKAGMMGFLGAGGMDLAEIEKSVRYIQSQLAVGQQSYGVNFLHYPNDSQLEENIIEHYLKWGVKTIEASAFMSVTPALIIYHAKGLKKDQSGKILTTNKIIAKLSRPEVAEAFLSPAPERLLTKLLAEKKLTPEEAELSMKIPVADYLCAEADSGGHTDGAVAYALMPAIIKLRDEMMQKYQYQKPVGVGAAGGIGTPEAGAAAFTLGADFIMTGSINQCTVEAATSDAVKNLLQQMNVQDTEYAPAGDMFELGAKVQVLKKGLFFASRANKLYELYRQHNSIDEIDEKTRVQIQEKYFKRSFEQVYEDIRAYYPPAELQKAERNPKHKMALILRWYFGYSSQLALGGNAESQVDYQVHCGPALGAFNQWVKGTELEDWHNRHVAEIAEKLMVEIAGILNQRFNHFLTAGNEKIS